MFKRLGLLGAVVAVVALALGVVGPAVGSSGGDDDDEKVITVISIDTEDALVDVGEPDFSLGDQLIFTSKLMKHGKRVGHAGFVCTITSVEMEESQCVGTAQFEDGQITVQGLLGGDVISVTGGSGAYEGADGELHIMRLSETRGRATFHLDLDD